MVQRISDGDTIRCHGLGRVRLIGIDSPEMRGTPYGEQARAALARWLAPGDTVQLEPDVEARDRYGRILAYVWRGGVMLNWLMLRHGWAMTYTFPPNVQYVEAFRAAQARARAEQRGLWPVNGLVCPQGDSLRRRC